MIVTMIRMAYSILRSIWKWSWLAKSRPMSRPRGKPLSVMNPISIGLANFNQNEPRRIYRTSLRKYVLSDSAGSGFFFAIVVTAIVPNWAENENRPGQKLTVSDLVFDLQLLAWKLHIEWGGHVLTPLVYSEAL